jgi:hypothetical protein
MNTAVFNDGTKISITPLMNNNFEFDSLIISEFAFGELPSLEMTIKTDKDISCMGDEESIKITFSNGSKINGTGYIYSSVYLNGAMTIKMFGVRSEFCRSNLTNQYSSLKDAISSTYKGSVYLNTESDISGNTAVTQISESNYHFCNRCCEAYRKYVIYGYTISGLVINTLTNFNPKLTLTERSTIKKSSASDLTNPKSLGYDSSIIDYSAGKDKYHVTVSYKDSYVSCNTECKNLIANYLYNRSMGDSKIIANYSSASILPLTLTDHVKLSNSETKCSKYYVNSIIYTISRSAVKAEYSFNSIDI